jgi:hypothetical protein
MQYPSTRGGTVRTLRHAVALAALAFTPLNPHAAPYTGSPVALPATLEAEDFDRGGEGVGYHDLSAANSGGQYRASEGVDIIAAPSAEGGGFVVNNFQNGEWLGYTVQVPASGTYTLSLRASHNYASPTAFHIEVDGKPVTGSVAVPKTGSWSTFQWVQAPAFALAAGTRVIRVVADAQYFNLNKLRLEGPAAGSPETPPASYSGTPYTGTPIALPRVFEAENFDKGGQEVAYKDLTSGNAGGQYRTSESVDIIGSSDPSGGGYVVNSFVPGEWLAYTVNVPSSGSYDLSVRAATTNGATFHLEVDGKDVTGPVQVPAAGSWSAFQWFGKTGVSLAAGKRVMKLVVDSGYFDVNQVSVLAAGAPAPAPEPVPSYSGTPYTGTPIALPGAFEAENFDKGGQEVAYKDLTSGNAGGQYRTSESVDIIRSSDPSGGGYVVNSFVPGEWLAYTVNVPSSGAYDLSVRAVSTVAASFHLELDGKDVTGPVQIPAAASWSAFQWFAKKGVTLPAGRHVIKLVNDSGYFDVNQLSVLLAGATPVPTPSPSPSPGNPAEPSPIAGKGYRLVKNWDFASGIRTQEALRNEFYTRYVYADGTLDTLNDEWQRYRDNNNHVFEDGALALVARLPSGKSLAPGNIESGMLRSKWYGQYGYFEARIKVPGGLGMWPAFWLNPQDQTWPPEIDVVEIVNNGRDTTRNSFHIVHGVGKQDATFSLLDEWHSYRPGFDYKDDYHTFAVEWTPDRVRHFVDDKLVVDRPYRWLHNDGGDGGPAHVLLNLAVGGSWPGAPTSSSLPAKLLVKHIRVWQR